MYLTAATDEVSELSRPWTEVSSRDRVEDTPSSVTTLERESVSPPVDFGTLPLHGKEHHKGGNGDSTRECGGSGADRRQTVKKVKREGMGHILVVLRPPTEESPLNVVVE